MTFPMMIPLMNVTEEINIAEVKEMMLNRVTRMVPGKVTGEGLIIF